MKMDKALVQQILASLPLFINFALVNCNSIWVTNAIYFMTQPNHHPSVTMAECGLMESCYQIGRFLLAIPSGIFADKYGRKHIINALGVVEIATWITLAMTHSVSAILVVRFIQGCAAAFSYTTGNNTIGEICSAKNRGLFTALFKGFGTLGNIAECLLAIFFCSYTATVYGTGILSLLFFFTIPFIIESPYYLMSSSKYEESKRILTKLRAGLPENEISEEYEMLKKATEHEKSIKSKRNWFQYLTLRSTRRPLICCILLNSLVLANGTNVLSLYATVIFPTNSYLPNNSYPLILSLIQLSSTMCTAFVIDAYPRRVLFMFAGNLAFLIQSFNGIAYYQFSTLSDDVERNIWKWAFLAGTVIFWATANILIMPLNLILKSEILPINIRGFGNSICLISQAISTIICYQVFNFVQSHFGTALNYALFATNSLLIVLVVYFLVPETRGKTLAEVQQSNHEGKNAEENTNA